MEKIAFDDIEALRAHITEDFGLFGKQVEVNQEMINQFADITGDHQWIHLDEERCKKESPFGTTIAHGFLTLSLLPALSGGDPSYVVTGAGNVTNYGSDGLRFLSPVPTDSKVHAHSRLKSVDAGKKGTRIVSEVAIHVVDSERPALVYDSIVLYQPPRA